jgi:RimJ/RimL family protein N-acetyltransferase
MTIEIKTERLLLRPLRMTDADDLLEYQSNAEIVRYIPWPERSYEQVVEALQRAIDGAKSELVDVGDYLILGLDFIYGFRE